MAAVEAVTFEHVDAEAAVRYLANEGGTFNLDGQEPINLPG